MGVEFKSTSTTPDQVTDVFRKDLAGWYEKAIESLYTNDNKTTWYESPSNWTEGKLPTLIGTYQTNVNDSIYGSAAGVLIQNINDIMGPNSPYPNIGSTGTPAGLSAEDLIARFKDRSIAQVAQADYAKYLAAKMTADEAADKEADPEGTGSDGTAELDEVAAEAAAEAAKADAARIKQAAEEAAAAAAARLSSTSAGNSVQINEQCFLLAFIKDILDVKGNSVDKTEIKPIPYHNGAGNSSLMVGGEPFGFMNLLTQYPSQKDLFQMSNAEISSLQPEIKLFKVSKDSRGNDHSIPITFDSYLETTALNPDTGKRESIFTNKAKRGYGAGLKSFSFTYEGNNPFSVKKSITAKLSIFANTFDELIRPRGGYNYLDLALKTGGTAKRKNWSKDIPKNENKGGDQSKLDFRLKAIVGWKTPPGNSGITTEATRIALEQSFVTLNLTPVIHNFDFDDLGRVKYEIEYFAFVEDFYNQPVYSIFSDQEVLKSMLNRKLKYASLAQDCKSSEIAELRRADKEQIAKDKTGALSWLVRQLTSKGKVRYISIPQAVLSKIIQEGPFVDRKSVQWNIQTIQGDVQEDALAANLNGVVADTSGGVPESTANTLFNTQITGDPGSHPVVFFFVSDLIDIILEGIGTTVGGLGTTIISDIKAADTAGILDSAIVKEQTEGYKRMAKNFERLRVLLGPVEIINPDNAAISSFPNLGDLPVSLKYFMEFLTQKTLQRDQVFYPLPTFLNDFFNIFLRTFLNDDTCFDREAGMKQRVRIQQATVTDYKRGGGATNLDTVSTLLAKIQRKDPYARAVNIKRYKSKGEPLLNVAGFSKHTSHPASGENDYLVYYAARAQPVREMKGIESTDAKSGVFHYRIGKDKGIVKTIKLNRTEMPGLKETRFEQGGYDGLEQLREVYNVSINCFANVAAYPGCYIFVNPLGFVPNMKYDVFQTAGQVKEGDQFDVTNLTDYGLGGYYMIIRSTHTFGPGKADTSITARWVQEIEKQADESEKTTAKEVDEDAERPAKCTVGENSSRETNADNPYGFGESTEAPWADSYYGEPLNHVMDEPTPE